MDKKVITTSGSSTVTLTLSPDILVSPSPTILFSNVTNFVAGSTTILAGGIPALPYVPL